jgi:hypothetical protein
LGAKRGGCLPQLYPRKRHGGPATGGRRVLGSSRSRMGPVFLLIKHLGALPPAKVLVERAKLAERAKQVGKEASPIAHIPGEA